MPGDTVPGDALGDTFVPGDTLSQVTLCARWHFVQGDTSCQIICWLAVMAGQPGSTA